MNVYHVTVPTTDGDAVVGACASGKTEAARLACERIASDGYLRTLTPVAAVKVAAQGVWTPGDTLVYSVDN